MPVTGAGDFRGHVFGLPTTTSDNALTLNLPTEFPRKMANYYPTLHVNTDVYMVHRVIAVGVFQECYPLPYLF
jgi:hypothetical protein